MGQSPGALNQSSTSAKGFHGYKVDLCSGQRRASIIISLVRLKPFQPFLPVLLLVLILSTNISTPREGLKLFKDPSRVGLPVGIGILEPSLLPPFRHRYNVSEHRSRQLVASAQSNHDCTRLSRLPDLKRIRRSHETNVPTWAFGIIV